MKNFLKKVTRVAVLCAAFITVMAANTKTFAAPTTEEVILSQINTVRAQRGLSELKADAELARAAQVRASESASVYSHTRPDNSAWYTVSAKTYGENLYKGDQFYDPQQLCVSMWTDSPSHYEVMMMSEVSQAGVGVVNVNGTYYIALEVG